jgi:hypothetical protein
MEDYHLLGLCTGFVIVHVSVQLEQVRQLVPDPALADELLVAPLLVAMEPLVLLLVEMIGRKLFPIGIRPDSISEASAKLVRASLALIVRFLMSHPSLGLELHWH